MGDQVESSRRAVKRIKLEVDKLHILTPEPGYADEVERPSSPLKGLRSSQHNNAPIVSSGPICLGGVLRGGGELLTLTILGWVR